MLVLGAIEKLSTAIDGMANVANALQDAAALANDARYSDRIAAVADGMETLRLETKKLIERMRCRG